MKKFFVDLGVIFACLIILGIILMSRAALTGPKLDAESKAYVDRIVPSIVGSWDSKDLLSYASPELLKVAPLDQIDPLFKIAAQKLGKLKAYKGSKGGVSVNVTPQGKVITASYMAQVAFDKADATVKILMIKHGRKWQVLGFVVDSPALLP
jgi:hypothetical protein